MSWGSWVLLIVYGILLVSALIRLPEAWPWLGRRVPLLQKASDFFVKTSGPDALARRGPTSCFGVAVGIYTGILLNTMVARPFWNTTVLPLLFLVSGLSAAAAVVHLRHGRFSGASGTATDCSAARSRP